MYVQCYYTLPHGCPAGCTPLPAQEHRMRVPVISQPRQHVVSTVIAILAILIGIKYTSLWFQSLSLMTNEVETVFMFIRQLHILFCDVLVRVFYSFS